MQCPKCKKDLNTNYLGICDKCNTIKWSVSFLNKNNENDINSILSKVDLGKESKYKVYADSNKTSYSNNDRVICAYAIKLNGSWEKNGINYNYYVGGTKIHPAIRFLQHLKPIYENNALRAKAMLYVETYKYKQGYHDNDMKELEAKLSKEYCRKGSLVYSDQHECKKCGTLP